MFFPYVWLVVFYNDKLTGCIVKVECLNVSACGAGAITLFFSLSNGAFTPDANESLSVSGLHVKSMQRHDRHNAA